ncbi:Protein of unknown function [Paucidesulfovibrio gracilis DSM 16080]|uniref:DUF721 domain-containing protein n=1 Tax=Paucidesulfovibrio gracilis DSM 16080 TaxID=1121449 RepID=A0A1T4W8V6_9BACT|nr:DUF721 domain-containing protein [Paucidesulfovibrio gracilis]SKA73559.1 Protein of unknown function [Paucidesulfovibrio gracilis DSM 16080]
MALFRRKYNIARAGDALEPVLDRLDGKGSMQLVRLWNNWENVMGREVSRMARPLGRRGPTLLLTADDPAVAQELTFFAPQIIRRANDFLGEEYFDKVRFELLNGRVPLDGYRPDSAPRSQSSPKKPKNLGEILDQMDEDSPVGRCYRAYIGLFRPR